MNLMEKRQKNTNLKRQKIIIKKLKKQVRGITLIALVVTIIVLLILASITIAALTGDNGILTRAAEAKNKTEEAQEKEGLELAVTSSQMEDVNTLEITEGKLSDAIKQQFGNNKDFSITDNGDGSFLVSMNDTQRMYYIDETGKIIDKILKISTAGELKLFRDDVNSGNTYEDWYIYLANDITLDINEEWEPIGVYPMENTSPEDESNRPFKGIFDGCNHEINGIYINTTDKVQGLFGLVINGTIKNVGIGEDCSISGNVSVGAIAGYLYDGSKAINCYNKSNLKVGSYSGGVFGQLSINCNIENCYNIGNINVSNNSRHIGGIVGDSALNSSIKKCYNQGSIEGNISTTTILGGISGSLSNESLLEECFNKGEISAKDIIGGITGQTINNVVVQNCYNVGDITGESRVGGINGQNTNKIYNCYNTGKITGNSMVGGISGTNQISTSYNTSGILRNTYSLEGKCEDICGMNSSTIEQSSIKTSDELKSVVLQLGIAFKNDDNNINNGYPILNWQ